MKTLWQYEAEFIELIARIRDNGIKIDKSFCQKKVDKGENILFNLRSSLGWNPASTKDLEKFLIQDMGFPVVKKTEKGNPSFDKYAMEEYDLMLEAKNDDTARKVFQYRGWQKTVSSNYRAYLELCDRNNILHPNYKVHGTRTCRTSCENPNLQQIPRSTIKPWNGDVKRAFIPRGDTVLVEFDYAQIEFRLAAAASGEHSLLAAFNSGVDAFDVMAAELNWPRQDCKTLTYATGYGAGEERIALIFGISREEARQKISNFFRKYPHLRSKAKQAAKIARHKKYIEYWTGRRRHFDDGKYHKAFNAYCQGGAFEIIKRAGVRLSKSVPWPIVLTVHDSYVLELPAKEYTPENCATVQSILEDVPESSDMGVKFAVSYNVWGEKS